MDVQRAKELLTILADGTDPLTGEVLPDDHVCNKGEIVRALNCAVEALLAIGKNRCRRTMESRGQRSWIKSCAVCSTRA